MDRILHYKKNIRPEDHKLRTGSKLQNSITFTVGLIIILNCMHTRC